MSIPCRVTIQWTTQTPAWKNLKDELPVSGCVLWWWSRWQRWVWPLLLEPGWGRAGEGVCAYLPRTGCRLCACKETDTCHLRAWTRGKGFLQEVNFGSQCGQRSRKQSHRVGITPEGSLGMKMAGLGGRSCPEGCRRSPREKDTVKTLARSGSSYHNTSTQDIVPALPSFPHSHGPIPGRVRNLSTQARPQFPNAGFQSAAGLEKPQLQVISHFDYNRIGHLNFWTETVTHLKCDCVCVCMLSHVWLFTTPWTVACQAPLSMEFSRQEYWSGLPFPSPGDLPDPEIEPASLVSLALAGRFFTTVPPEKPQMWLQDDTKMH